MCGRWIAGRDDGIFCHEGQTHGGHPAVRSQEGEGSLPVWGRPHGVRDGRARFCVPDPGLLGAFHFRW